MADPTKYTPSYSYSGWQATNPSRPLPADEVDNDLANVSRSINQTIDALRDIRRSDGKLKNQSVGPDQLSAALSLGFTLRGPWAPGQTYETGDGVVKEDGFYSARSQHVSSLSNAPPNATYWNFLFNVSDIAVAGALAMPRDEFVGDGVETDFSLSFSPVSPLNVLVAVGGVIQAVDEYLVNGNVLTFVTAPPNGYPIEVRGFATTADLTTPVDGSVSRPKLSADVLASVNKADTALQQGENLSDLTDLGAAQDSLQAGAYFISLAVAQTATIPARNKRISTQFHTPLFISPSSLVGGCHYRRISFADLGATPTQAYFRSTDRFMPDGSTDATNGGYWIIDEVIVDWRMLGVKADNLADDTAAAQAAINFCLLDPQTRTLCMTGTARVSKIGFYDASNVRVIFDNCFLVANSTDPQTCLLEIKVPNFVSEGRLPVIVGYRTNYECAVWYWHETACQFSVLRNLIPNGAKIGFRIGNIAYPAALISETTVENPQTYGCPVCMEVIGRETYIQVSNPQLSADAFGGDASWEALEKIVLRNIGASVNVAGGEAIVTSSPNGVVHEMQPVATESGTRVEWGSTIFNGVFCESAAPLSRTANPGGLVINNGASNRRGMIQFNQCLGYHSQDLDAFISVDSTYDDYVVVNSPGFWKPGATRTFPNVYCAPGSTAEVTVNGDFGPGFQQGHAGVSGGRLNFSRRQLLRAVGLNGRAFTAASGPETCLYTSLDSTNDKARWQTAYNAATGEFTIPDGGLTDVDVFVSFRLAGTSTGNLVIQENGTEVARAPVVAGVASLFRNFGDMSAGTKIKVSVDVDTNDSGNAANFLNTFSLFARRGHVN